MPNQALIDDLSTALETYNQRRRATDGLLRTLKGANNALTKAKRTLDDYAEQNVNPDTTQVRQSQQAMDGLNFKDGIYDVLQLELRRESNELSKQIKAVRDAMTALQGDMVDLIKLDHAYQILQQTPFHDSDVQAIMPDLESEIEQAQARLGVEFGAALRDALAEIGIAIGGRPPRFETRQYLPCSRGRGQWCA